MTPASSAAGARAAISTSASNPVFSRSETPSNLPYGQSTPAMKTTRARAVMCIAA